MGHESFRQFPITVRKGEKPNTYITRVTEHTVTREFLRRKVRETQVTSEIDFESFGITNPVVARGCIGLLELGILRNPQDLIYVLEAYKENRPQEQQNPSLTDIIYTVLPKNDRGTAKHVMGGFAISRDFLSQIYGRFMPYPLSQSFDRVVERLMDLPDQQEPTAFLDTFIRTYVGIRRAALGNIEAHTRKGKSREQIIDKLVNYIGKKLYTLGEEYKKTFQSEQGYTGDKDLNGLRTIVSNEVNNGIIMLDLMRACPPEFMLAQKSAYQVNTYTRTTIITDLRSNSVLTSLSSTDVDGVTTVLLPTGKVINFYSMRACPFVAHSNHPKTN